MYIYIWTLLLSLLFASALQEVRKYPVSHIEAVGIKVRKEYVEYMLLFMSMIPFIMLCGLRYEVGADYSYTYTKIYDLVAQGLSHSQVNGIWNCEIGFYLFNKIIFLIGGGYVWVFTISAAVIIGLFWTAFYQQSDNLCMSIVLFFVGEAFFISLCYVRQYMAMAIIYYGLKYLDRSNLKKMAKFVRCVLLAMTFHKSAIIMLLLIPMFYIKLHPALLAAAVAVFSLLKDSFEKLLIWVLEFTPYRNYIGSRYQAVSRFYSTRPLVYIAVFLLARWLYRKCREDRNHSFMMNVTALLVLITSNFDIMPQLDRITWYFEAILLIFIPYLLNRIENPWLKKVITAALLVTMGVFTYHSVVAFRAHGVIPYRLVFAPDMIFK